MNGVKSLQDTNIISGSFMALRALRAYVLFNQSVISICQSSFIVKEQERLHLIALVILSSKHTPQLLLG